MYQQVSALLLLSTRKTLLARHLLIYCLIYKSKIRSLKRSGDQSHRTTNAPGLKTKELVQAIPRFWSSLILTYGSFH